MLQVVDDDREEDKEVLVNSFLNVSAEAKSCGSIMRQPTELAVLLAGIGILPLADNGGKANTCDATDEAVSEASDEGRLDDVGSDIEADRDVAVDDVGFVMGPIMGLAVSDGGNCTVGNDGTGKTIAPAVAIPAEPVVKLKPIDDVDKPLAAAKFGKTLAREVASDIDVALLIMFDGFITSSSAEFVVAFVST